MNTPDSRELSRLVSRLSDGSLTPQEAARLNELLQADPAAQEAYLDHMALDALLEREFGGELPAFARQTPPAPARRWPSLDLKRLFRGPLFAGIALGGLSASAVWAYALPRIATPAARELPLAHSSFESSAPIPPDGIPVAFGQWSGDFTEQVGPESGIAPREGDRMLRFLRADDSRTEAGTVSLSSELWQIIDVAELRKSLPAGSATLEFSANFNSLPDPGNRFSCGVSIHAFDGSLKDAHMLWRNRVDQALASGTKEEVLEPNGGEWRRVSTQIVLPADATFLLVQLLMRDRTKDLSATAEFPGHFADGCSLRLLEEAEPR